MVRQGKILGHIVSKNGISIVEEKINTIVAMPLGRKTLNRFKDSWDIVAIIVGLFFSMPTLQNHYMR